MFSLNTYLQCLLSSNFKFLSDNESFGIFIKKAILHRKEFCCLTVSRNYQFQKFAKLYCNEYTSVKSEQSLPRAEQMSTCKPCSEQVQHTSAPPKLQVKIPIFPVAVSILVSPLTSAWNIISPALMSVFNQNWFANEKV